METKIEEPLHGDWLVVKNNKQRSRKSKTAKGGKNAKANNAFKDKKPKSYATRDHSKSYADMVQHNNSTWVPSVSQKPRDAIYTNEKNKRPRQDPDTPIWSPVQPNVPKKNVDAKIIKTKDSKNREVQHNVKIFDLGDGAKSSVKMKAISNNRYVLLHDDDEENNEIDTAKSRQPSNLPDGVNQEVVPETQPLPDSMVV